MTAWYPHNHVSKKNLHERRAAVRPLVGAILDPRAFHDMFVVVHPYGDAHGAAE